MQDTTKKPDGWSFIDTSRSLTRSTPPNKPDDGTKDAEKDNPTSTQSTDNLIELEPSAKDSLKIVPK